MGPDMVREHFEHMGWTIESDVLENTDGLKQTMVLNGKDFFGHKVKKLVVEFTGEQETNLKLSFVRVVLDSSVSAADITTPQRCRPPALRQEHSFWLWAAVPKRCCT